MKTRILIALSVLTFSIGFVACKTEPQPKPGYHLPTGEITNGVTLVTYHNGVPDLAPNDLAEQMYKAGGRPQMTNATIWVFDVVDTPQKRAAIDAAVLQGAKILGVRR